MKAFLRTFSENYQKVWSLFLPSSVVSILFAVFGITMVWLDAYDDAWIVKLLLVLVISFFLFLVWSSWVQSNKRKFSIDLIGAVILVGLLIAYYVHLPANFEDFEQIYFIRHVLITVASVGLVFVCHYQWQSNTKKFWNFSRATAESIIQSVFFSGVLFVGLALTVASVNFLFELDIPDEIYPSLWFAVAGGFTTFYFMSKLPVLSDESDESFHYNKLWKFLGVYILLPLLALYFLVLYAYTGKVLLTWEWPSGQISYMIAAFSFVGTLTYWMLTPQVEGTSKAWHRYTPVFWSLLLVQVVVLFIAIGLRINQYGITPNRYLVVLFGIYLLALCVYFLLSKIRDRRIIPVLFSGLILLTSVGPWGVFGVSKISQTRVIHQILERNQMINADGKIQAPTQEVSKQDRRQLSSALEFLWQTYGEESMERFSDETDVDSVRELLQVYDVEYVSRWDIDERELKGDHWNYHYLNLNGTLEPFNLAAGKDIFLFRKQYNEEELGVFGGTTILFKNEGLIEIIPASGPQQIVSLREWLQSKDTGKSSEYPVEEVTFESDELKMIFTNISYQTQENKVKVDHAAGILILK